jgi:hypothetical protein
MAAILPTPNFRSNLRLKFEVGLSARQIAAPSGRSGKHGDYACYRAFHPLAVHPGQPATTELASQRPDLTVVYVKASQTRCFAFKDIFVL